MQFLLKASCWINLNGPTLACGQLRMEFHLQRHLQKD
uniref:Uncharacterized protein n=1 Tax=Rhizophora mucronata TaxID=61149 RepID=A0A2P2K0N2_RHIMU